MNKTMRLLLLACLPLMPMTAGAEANPTELISMSLEELLNVVVTTVSKKSQTLAETAAAVHVISAEEIRRSGATNIPEALRLAPGVQVAAIGNNKWAVSIRGQADRFSNKLLVLVDGRSVYHPMFSGVIWEALDVPIETIERIEVIRGPGASIWGANAVNGVINILTRSPFDRQGGELAMAAGTEHQSEGYASLNWRSGTDTAMQVHAHARDTGSSRFVGGGAGVDDWKTASAGFKLRHRHDDGSIQFQGGLSSSRAGDELVMITEPAITSIRHVQKISSGHFLGRWDGRPSESHQHSVQAYLEHSHYDHIILREERTTFDVEYQDKWLASPIHDLVWGVGYRYSRDRVQSSGLVTIGQSERATSLYSLYVQDEITLTPGRWRVILGARIDHNDYTGFEFQPNARLLWTPNAQSTAWISLARAIRSPSRVERGGTVYLPLSSVSALQMDNGLGQGEGLDALDLGWRHQFGHSLSLDLAGFHYRYRRLRDAAISGPPVPQAGGYVFIPTINTNANSGTAAGIEVSLDWRPRPEWRLQMAYSFLDAAIHLSPVSLSSGYADTTPMHLVSLRSQVDLSPSLQWDAWLRRVGRVDIHGIPSYTALDIRLAWKLDRQIELAAVGQNLLDSSHPEFGSGFILSTPSEIERGFYLKANWKF